MKYEYFISYWREERGTWVFGNANVTREAPIASMYDVVEIGNKMNSQFGGVHIILNWKSYDEAT